MTNKILYNIYTRSKNLNLLIKQNINLATQESKTETVIKILIYKDGSIKGSIYKHKTARFYAQSTYPTF